MPEKEQLRMKRNQKGEQCFIEYFQKLANKRKGRSNYDNWVSY